jgi:hypothetical protein
MRATDLSAVAADRLVKLLGMLGSHHDGERAAAALKADQLVRQHGLTWHDVISVPAPMQPWRRMAARCQAHAVRLNSKELGFVDSMLRWNGEPSDKQLKWLIDLFVRTGGAS